jgi:hypothetical protein
MPRKRGKRRIFFMRKALIVLCVFLLTAPLVAQQNTGQITGETVDEEGNSLPGVSVTLSGSKMGTMSTVTSAEGLFRFLGLFPGSDYVLKAELAGFKTKIEEGVIVALAKATNIIMVLEIGTIEEQVTVRARSPVVEAKQTKVTHTSDYQTLQSMPSARDPWVVLQMTPAVQVDRENIGGSESGQQSTFVTKGGSRYQTTWTVDGVNITDPAARGASPTYYDYDIFEEMSVTTGAADVETQTGGIALNLVSRRGGNKVSFGGRFYYTQSAFQSMPSGDQYEALKVIFGADAGYNRIRDIKDFGFNVGGPIWKDKVWWWVSYGVQQIKTAIITGAFDDTYLNNYAAKLNIQPIPDNRLELFAHLGEKAKFGRSASTTYPNGWNQKGKYAFGSPILKVQDEHMVGNNLFLSAKFGHTDAGFGMWPAHDEDLNENVFWYDIANSVATGSYSWFFTGRPNSQFTLHATYFNDNLLGMSHEVKVGYEYIDRRDQYVSGYPGNIRIYNNYNSLTMDWDNDGNLDVVKDDFGIDIMNVGFRRGTLDWAGPEGNYHHTAFIQDTVSFGRFSVKLGVRWDIQIPWFKGGTFGSIMMADSTTDFLESYYELQQALFGPGVGAAINGIFPEVTVPPVTTAMTQHWDFWSPRFGITWDATGDGKTIVKLAGGIYGDRMGSYYGYLWKRSGYGGWLNVWWADDAPAGNGDGKIDLNELYWRSYDADYFAYQIFDAAGNFIGDEDRERGLEWSGYDWDNPGATSDPRYIVDDEWKSSRTYEVTGGVERELFPNASVAVYGTWRIYNRWWTNRSFKDPTKPYDENNLVERTDYVKAPNKVPTSWVDGDGNPVDLGQAAGRDWYVLAAGIPYIYERFATTTPSDYYDQYIGVDFVFNKRLSDRWMFNASFTWQDQRNNWGATYPLNPTDQWSTDGKPYAYSLGGASGKLSQPIFSRWMVKAMGLYQLPYGFDVSFTFNAREGHIIPKAVSVYDTATPNSRDRSETIYTEIYGSSRLPTMANLNFRLQKVLNVGDVGRVYIMVDVFNVFNSNILNRQRAVNPGTIYIHSGGFASSARSGEPNEVLNPRVFRFGVRFQFN